MSASAGLEIAIQNPNRFRETGARRLRPWLERLAAALAPARPRQESEPAAERRSLGVRFVGDREMQRVNRGFRGVDRTTDVLSFPGEPGMEGVHLGDIVISVPAARRQALAAGHAVEVEVRILLLHGLLHCLGHDHETDGGEMASLERRLRRTWVERKGGAWGDRNGAGRGSGHG